MSSDLLGIIAAALAAVLVARRVLGRWVRRSPAQEERAEPELPDETIDAWRRQLKPGDRVWSSFQLIGQEGFGSSKYIVDAVHEDRVDLVVMQSFDPSDGGPRILFGVPIERLFPRPPSLRQMRRAHGT